MRICLIILAGLCLTAPTVDGRKVYISKVAKDSSETNFYNRLAKNDYHVIATDKNSKDAVEVTEPLGSKVMLVELPSSDYQLLHNEVARFGDIAITVVENFTPGYHDHSNHMLYFEPVNTHIQSIATLKQATNLTIKAKGPEVKFEIDPLFLAKKIKEFTGVDPIEIDGQSEFITNRQGDSNRKLARKYLKAQYQALGFEVSEHNYGRGANFIAERKGRSDQYVVISSHYDTVATAGADDNAAGTITALAVAKALSDINFEYSLRVLAFDQEELGLVGSKEYAKHLSNSGDIDNLVGVLNLEMTGYDSDDDGGFHVIDCNENNSPDLTEVVMQAVSEASLNLTKVFACTNRSDHASFWRYDKPAIVVSENFFGNDSNPCYHRSCDKIDQMNFSYMTKITQAIAGATYHLLQPVD